MASSSATTSSLLLRNYDVNVGTKHVGCWKMLFHQWSDLSEGPIEWIYTTKVKHGCVAIAIVSTQVCFLGHWLQTFEADDAPNIWANAILGDIYKSCHGSTEIWEGGRLFIIAPKDTPNAGSADANEAPAKVEIQTVARELTAKTKLTPEFPVYSSTTASLLPDYATFEVNYRHSDDEFPVPKIFFNCMEW